MKEEDRQQLFQSLKEKGNKNMFLLVGPPHHLFCGNIQAQFESGGTDVTISNRPSLPLNRTVIELVDSDQEEEGWPLPTFVRDSRHFMPTFGCDEGYDEEYKTQFSAKLRDYRMEVPRDQLLQSRPKSKHNYCTICKQHYQQYLGHVGAKHHQYHYQNNRFTRLIAALEFTLNTGIFKQLKEINIRKQMREQEGGIRMEKKKRRKEDEDEEKRRKEDSRGGTAKTIRRDLTQKKKKESTDRLSRSRQKRGRGRPRGSKLNYNIREDVLSKSPSSASSSYTHS